ncbi:MAG: 16S rRNA (adenine(1518)-N(6)/adenine(1519)-N(6))-dimethyltransferase RsmA [Rickettsiales bacterium]|jgi:16S rRNA (adenine1518-N6/adenine1519-N6)-dimethyltransferase|nr:16S rRNA (adenine(1518)-N(6)/adenine(1519)-N(6))-dimethyltransferase RsmA [Rickettsiales bacterium]
MINRKPKAESRKPGTENISVHGSRFTVHDLPPVADMMRAAGLEPKKQLGQNFLFDLNLTLKIARSVPDIENMTVAEVGPGPGGLTRALLMAGAKHVIAIEKDRATEPILNQIAAASDGRLEIIFGDAMNWAKDEGRRMKDEYAICSNLPYNVGTELLIQWLHLIGDTSSIILHPSSLTLMFQREVAMRIVARVGDAAYGRLSVLTSLVADAKILFNVPPTAFYPKPKVMSSVVQIIPKAESGKRKAEIEKVEILTAKLFGQRRKMIRGIIPNVDWEKFGLTGRERAQELSPEKFTELAAAGVV